MKNLNSIAVLGGAAASVMLFAVPANALIITQTINFAGTVVSYSGVNGAPTLSLFDTSLGTLTSVVISSVVSGNTAGTVTNNALTAGTLSASFVAGRWRLTASDVSIQALFTTNYTNPDNGVQIRVTSSDTSPVAVNPGSSYSFSFTNGGLLGDDTSGDTGFGSNTFTGANALLFAGVGSITLGSNMNGTSQAGNTAGTFSSTVVTTEDAVVTVVYNYTAPPPPPPPPPTGTPEPASMALLGAGLVGLGAAVRRRRKV